MPARLTVPNAPRIRCTSQNANLDGEKVEVVYKRVRRGEECMVMT